MVVPDLSGYNHCCTRYSDRTRPEAYGATALTRNPRWWLTTSQDSNHTRNPSRARYSDRTRPDTYVATVPARVPMHFFAFVKKQFGKEVKAIRSDNAP
uniref:Integrase catalytic domain-containing protein n=1 Tax=Vitis vinifera TaxID=29760 RepID=F6I517_VITVI